MNSKNNSAYLQI